jgi:hypothetical protein
VSHQWQRKLQPDVRIKNDGTPASSPSPWMLTKVSDMYTDPFVFQGALDRVIFNLSDEVTAPALVPGVYR